MKLSRLAKVKRMKAAYKRGLVSDRQVARFARNLEKDCISLRAATIVRVVKGDPHAS